MKKFLTLGVSVLFLAGTVVMTGCDLFGPSDNEDEVTITVTAVAPVTAGSSVDVEGAVEANVDISDLTFAITLDGAAVAGDNVRVNVPSYSAAGDEVDLAADAQLQIITTPDACTDSYVLTISAKAGTATTSKTVTFDVTGGIDCGGSTTQIALDTVTLGSWNHQTLGSCLDADEMVVYTRTQVTAAIEGDIDIFMANQDPTGVWLMSPSVAAGQSHYPTNWTTKNTTQFIDVTGDITLAGVTSQDDIDALWTANSASAVGWVAITANDFVIVQTDQGVNRLLYVVSVVDADDGTGTIIGISEVVVP